MEKENFNSPKREKGSEGKVGPYLIIHNLHLDIDKMSSYLECSYPYNIAFKAIPITFDEAFSIKEIPNTKLIGWGKLRENGTVNLSLDKIDKDDNGWYVKKYDITNMGGSDKIIRVESFEEGLELLSEPFYKSTEEILNHHKLN